MSANSGGSTNICMHLLEKIGVSIIWMDSMGAKCFSIALKSSLGYIVIDPGAAEMQPSYPLPSQEKRDLRRKAIESIHRFMRKAYAVIITHYHYDHHALPSDPDVASLKDFWNAKLWILKNPNIYINESQWNRARKFLAEFLMMFGHRIENHMQPPLNITIEDPVEELNIALSKDFGDYNSRRRELLLNGKRWFSKLCNDLWLQRPWIKEIEFKDKNVVWGDGKRFSLGGVDIEITKPWFHGVEYDRTGWIVALKIIVNGWRLFYSSDVMGPIIEDYAEEIILFRPDVLILDGPPTYLYPYMFNRINLNRAIENVVNIITSARPKLLIYDHHLLREKRWRERTRVVFDEAKKNDVLLLTAAECLGKKPLIDML